MWFLTLSYTGVMSDEFRTCAAAAANDIHDAFIDEFGYLRCHRFGSLVIFAHFVRQTGIRMRTYIIRCNLSHVFYERLHLRSAKGTVHADREDRIRRKRSQESIYSLTTERSARQITYRKTDHDRQLYSMFLHHGERCIYHRLAVECIKDGFDENHVSTAFDKSVYLFAYIGEKLIVGNLAGGRIADVRTHGTCLVGWSHISCNEAWFIRCRELIAFDTCQSGTLECHFAGAVLQVIISLRNALARKSIRGNNIGASLQVASVNIRYHIRTSDVEHVVVAFHHTRQIAEPLSSEVFFCKVILLNLSTHGTIENQNFLLHNLS